MGTKRDMTGEFMARIISIHIASFLFATIAFGEGEPIAALSSTDPRSVFLDEQPQAPLVPAPAPRPQDFDIPAARPGLVNEREVMTQLQIFLDQQLFGPGKIDGEGGEFTLKALIRYQRAHDLPETG
ncbi:MAG: peptidoglycan-binding domain-containing protein, partial [Chthoniobacteraceae bacterium]